MKRKIVYTDAPPEIEASLDRAVTVKDYLPPPSELILKIKPQGSVYSTEKRISSTYKKKEVEYV